MQHDRFDRGPIEQTVADNPGKTATLGLLTTPLAMKMGGIALRWARRNPGLAFTVAAGALAVWGLRSLKGAASRSPAGAGAEDPFRFPGAAHGSVTGYGSGTSRDAGSSTVRRSSGNSGSAYAPRSTGGDTSSASSL
jgi:hypothetical protein